MSLSPAPLGFRPLREDDLPTMHRWLNTEHVMVWYGPGGATYEQVEAKYRPRIREEEPTRSFLILYDDLPIGYIQTYLIADWPDQASTLLLSERSAGVDLFIGEPDYLHRGLGSHILTQFLQAVVFVSVDVESCVIDPRPDNLAAIKAYERAGFRFVRLIEHRENDDPAYVMRIGRSDLR